MINTDCCGSQLYHTGMCCQDESVNQELAEQVLNATEETKLKDCACKGLGPCQCPPVDEKEEILPQEFKDLTYAATGCGCGGSCACN